jgi:hypothetical protein
MKPRKTSRRRPAEADLTGSFMIRANAILRFPPFGGQLDLTLIRELPTIHCGLKGEKLERYFA